ncbi:D-lactaldehyde dehydrogenase [Cryptococcus neoformans var. grubii Br795]|uniref:D-lactaldehyde dehydrogenase n=1 Tax=Cryptococcus neoformans Tu259-1 TaxID=1230072 RepID=A0A854QBY4_CRYNE|nr:D-lactaldehyde dehydrogenase [Cryptococcus neoformans var. grubii Bt1]OWZ41358.1 D-lactaldehyde dehydrogenase [Cryptococcus neoformans var. grubii AD1-83a]OWZ53990.1 D-lactaldehyde dehydrogenase [Cryptococcus neoformans var. grubii 125.91]OXG19892.1 D-lactaldehyde dehydrogenase [Cryptococcus neoformans var. grubii Tu259-1]OXG24905.1 D-lactaldehyde dehydrogenase [Cryptococcus neoformans var. grubii Ze90-1]OXG32051.1 D-lactaldehyde dehydrogenase [Cryptococcus neoformans var. grubii Bt15]OXG3
MPAIAKGDLILVSGASGFIASHTVKEFLKEGFRVRGTVRSKEKGEYLKNLFQGLGEFEYVLVDDITKDGIFDEAVKGVNAVAHLASPFYVTNVKDPKELIDPAVKGTTGILKSVQKNNPKVKRVVITSSVAAIMCPISKKSPFRYTEADWNVDSIPQVEEKGVEADGMHSYLASKTLAEKALWNFVEDEKPSWDAVAINPPYVLGEVIHQCDKPEKLNTSVASFWSWPAGEKTEKDLPSPIGNWVDVKEVALGHVRALTVPEAGGQRFIISAGPLAGQDYADILHKRFPEVKNVPVGKSGTHDEVCKELDIFDGKKAEKVLGIKYHTPEETVVDMFESLRKRFNKF